MPPKPVVVDPVLGPLTDDLLTRDVRVFQREKGHRFSSDDIVTAHVAWNAGMNAARVLDLGCGLGSVLLTLAWKMPNARFVGVEAQDPSFELLTRNVARSAFADRITIHHGDLREPEVIAALGGPFDLVTGTPPYFPKETALDAEDPQRAYARIEYRGGVEAYLKTGARVLAPSGVMVMCGAGGSDARVRASADDVGLAIVARLDVLARTPESPLFSVWTLAHASLDRAENAAPREAVVTSLALRDSEKRTSAAANAIRAFCGFGPTA